ncbi:MAG: DUF6404 family protein [Pseudomonadota bacterium]|nr:DUF6404 family protein [Pseudomonadota bacterium]
MSNYDRKFQAAIREMKEVGIWKSNANPPLLRLFRRFGLKVRPPHYGSLMKNGFIMGIWFAGVWGLLMWFLWWRADGKSFAEAALTSATAGVLFGVGMTAYYAFSRKKHHLSAWEEL